MRKYLRFSAPAVCCILLICLSVGISRTAFADTSPEFHQLLGELNGQLKTFVPTRGPRCTPDLIDKVQNALQGELFRSALTAVVVKPLEAGAKKALSLLGVPGAVITTYSLMRCAMDESSGAGFGKCALKEALGVAQGAGMGKAGIDSISASLAGDALGDAYDRARGAFDSYGSSSEVVTGESEGDCKIRYRIQWQKRRVSSARGGKIYFQAWVSDCKCRTANNVKSGYVSAWFNVHYQRAGNNQPGWTLGSFQQLHVEVQCCRQHPSAKNRVFLFNPQGGLVPQIPEGGQTPTPGDTGSGEEEVDEPEDTTPEPQEPPKPKPIVLKPPDKVEYTRANPCPPCKPIQDKVTQVAQEIGDLRRQRSTKLGEKNQKEEQKGNIERRISRLESRLRGEAGVGGESYDPSTRTTTSSYDMGDGRVRIRVTDAQGNIISERFRQRESTEEIQAKLAAKKQELEQAKQDIERLENEIKDLDAKKEEAIRRYDNLQKALTDCVKKLCGRYATCEQLLKHIQNYRNAGLEVRSRDIINRLMKRAREMGCFGIGEEMSQLVQDNYDLTGQAVYKPSIELQETVKLGIGSIYLIPCKQPSSQMMGYNPNGTPMDGMDGNHDFSWHSSADYRFPNGALIAGLSPNAEIQDFNGALNGGGKINCKKLKKKLQNFTIVIIFEDWLGRKIQEGQDKPQITPNDTYYKFEASAGKKAVRGLMKGLGALQGLGGGGISLGGGGGSKKGTADDQWGLWKVGFTPLDSPSSAWKIETGEGKPVVVAVIDSGLDITHPDLSLDNLWKNEGEIPGNFIDDDGNGYIDDTFGWNFIDWNNVPFDNNGHGTFVAGIIAAKSNNGIGIAGINQGVRVMPLKVTNYIGESNNFDIYRAIVYAVDNGASIINISIGGDRLSKLEQIAVDYAYSNGVVVVVAAGNQGKELVDYGPSGLQKVLTVAALDVSGRKRGSSNYGPTVAITAPGEEIISLRARETDFLKRLGGGSGILGEDRLYYKSTGSSFATPFVTGVASLLKAKDPDLTSAEVEGILIESALDIEDPGWDIRSGAGLLNARGALSATKEKTLTARITKIEKVAEGKKIVSYKIYGVVSGETFKDYSLSVGKGKKPKKWSSIGIPFKEAKEYDLLGIVDGKNIKGFGTWNIRLTVNSTDGKVKEVYLPFPKK